MSAPHRPFLRRFTLALLGMLLLMAVVFAGLGWMVARKPANVISVIGLDKERRLWSWYLVFMANLLSGDRDGDLVCDGAELFCGTDPNSAVSCWPIRVSCIFHSTNPTIAYCG